MAKKFIYLVIILSIYLAYKLNDVFTPAALPLLEDTWWGPGEPGALEPAVRPFSINISDEELNDLKWRLTNHRTFTPPLEGVAQQYGMNTELLNEIVEFWKNKYDWRAREKFLNKYPQFKINIQGLDIHYLHVKPKSTKKVKVLPLLLIHGWPGSVREFYDILPLLTTPQEGHNFVFEVIAPHIPGYGFSQAAVRPGLGTAEVAVVFKNMMHRLGFKKFYAQGGDFGHIILHHLSILFPESVLGFHSNVCTTWSKKSYLQHFAGVVLPWLPWCYVKPEHYNRVFPVKASLIQLMTESAYLHLQATKPDTVGVGVNDSPVGLAAYILEKMATGTNFTYRERRDGGLKEYFTYEGLLDNIMIYWWTKSATTSFRLYSETFNQKMYRTDITEHQVLVPSACARFSNDLYATDGVIHGMFRNLVHLNDYEGGHFAALQLPKVLAKDIFMAVEKFEIYNAKNS